MASRSFLARAAATAALTALTALTLLAAAPRASAASAHGGDPHLTVDQFHPAEGATHYILKMVWDDGDAISGKVVTATPIGPDGKARDKVTMEPFGDGQYQGLIPMPEPGAWKVQFESVDPTATVEATTTMTAPTSSTEATTSTSQATSPTTKSSGDDSAAGTSKDGDDDDTSSSGPIIAAALIALLAVCVGAAFLYRRANRGSDEPPLAGSG